MGAKREGQHGGKRPGAGRKPGKTTKARYDLMAMAQTHAEDALRTLVDVHKNTNETAGARVSAATAILDRGYGKPSQALEHTGKDGEGIRHDVRIVIVDPKAR